MNWSGLEKRKKQVIGIVTLVMLLAIGFVWLLPMNAGVSLRVEYAREYENDFYAQLFWMTDNSYAEEKSSYIQVKHNRVELEVREAIDRIQELRFDPTNMQEETAITSIQIRKYGIGVMEIPVRELMQRAQFIYMEQPEVTRGVLSIVPQSDDSVIILGQDIVEDYFVPCQKKFKVIATVWVVLAAMLLWLAVIYSEYLKKAVDYMLERYDAITRVILFVALFFVGYMAFNSFDYAHPDENMSKAAVDYYVEHWKPADIRSPEVADTFSAYGSSRLSETTIYYFLAGKVAWIAKNVLGIEQYYRAFNVLLFAVMIGIYCKKGRKNNFLFLMLGLTPQIWYIFSYATSDAWDYFCMFLVVYQLLVEESMLNKTLETPKLRNAIFPLILTGMLWGILTLGKKNYFLVFIISFILLLNKWIKNEKKMLSLSKYAIILIMCSCIFLGISGFDYVRYGGNKSEIKQEMQIQYADDEYLADNNGIFQNEGVQMKAKGVPLHNLFTVYHFGEYSFKSFSGNYGWMEYESDQVYYWIVGFLYFLMATFFVLNIWHNENKWIAIGLNCLIPAIIGVSVWNSWVADFQPQGRYLFPLTAIVAYDYKINSLSQLVRSGQKGCSILLGIMSIYSFVFSAIGLLCF